MTRAALLCLAVLLAGAGCTGETERQDGNPSFPRAKTPSGSQPLARYTLAADGTAAGRAAATAAVQGCLDLPGVTWKPTGAGDPSRWRVTAGGQGLREFQPCVEKVAGYAAVPISDADAAFVEQCTGGDRQLVVPSYIGLTEDAAMRTKPADAAARVGAVRVVARDGDCLTVVADLRPDRVDLVVRDGRVIWAGLPDTANPARPVGDDGIAVDICLDERTDCRRLDPEASRRIRLALGLDNAVPASPGSVYCGALGPVYTVRVRYDSGDPQDVTVPMVCAPMQVNGQDYPLDGFVREQVRLAYAKAK